MIPALAIQLALTQAAEAGYSTFHGEIRTVPALVFLPMSGRTEVNQDAMRSYLLGGSAGFFNFDQGSVLDLSLVMVGVRWSDVVDRVSTEKQAIVADMVYGRVGPRMRFLDGLIGFQAGYGGIIVGDKKSGHTRHYGGFDVSFDVRVVETKRRSEG
jgi:hypothetical protein